MRLLVVTQYFWPEPFRINDICEGLVERGHKVDVLTSLPNIPQGKFYEGYNWFHRGEPIYNGIGVDRVAVIERGSGSAMGMVLNCASFALNSMFHLHKYKCGDYDAIFVFNNSPVSVIWPAKLLARRLKIPLVVWILDLWPESMYFLLGQPEDGKETLLRRISLSVCRSLYSAADLLLMSSKGFEQRLKAMGITNRMEYFPNYAEKLPEPDGSALRETYGLKEDDFVIGFSGNIGKAQGLELTIPATLKADIPNLRWMLIGDGPALADLKREIKAEGLEDSYRFIGWVSSDRIPNLLSLCDGLLVSLKKSVVLDLTVPAKLQTYMNAAKPVIAFMDGAGAELTERAECGVAAKAEDPEALAEACRRLYGLRAEERERLGENGKNCCAREFDRDRLIDRLCDFLEESIEDKKRG